MYFASAVKAYNYIVHLFIKIIYSILIQRDTVCGHGEVYMLIKTSLKLPAIGHQFLYHFKVHKRFAAEKIHLKIMAAARPFHKKVKRLPANLRGHHHALPAELSRTRKAIRTAQVAIVRHMKAKRFYYVPLSVLDNTWFICVQRSRILQFSQLRNDLLDFSRIIMQFIRIIPLSYLTDNVIGGLINTVYRTAFNIQYHI